MPPGRGLAALAGPPGYSQRPEYPGPDELTIACMASWVLEVSSESLQGWTSVVVMPCANNVYVAKCAPKGE